MQPEQERELKIAATKIRIGIITGVGHAGCGHPGGAMSCADMLSVLYFKEMKVDPAQPRAPWRDRLVLSKGHSAPGLYAALALRGFLTPVSWSGFAPFLPTFKAILTCTRLRAWT